MSNDNGKYQQGSKGQHAPSSETKPLFVDGALGQRLYVEYKPKIKHNTDKFHDGHLSFVIVGLSGSGKSTLMCSFVPYIANLSQIIMLSYVTDNPAHGVIENYCRANGIDYIPIYEIKNAQAIIEKARDTKPPNTEGLIIFDDFHRYKPSKSEGHNNLAINIVSVWRNFGYHNMFICTANTNIPTEVRGNANIIVTFGFNQDSVIRTIRANFISSGVIKTRKEFDNYFALVQEIEHSFLMLDTIKRALYIFIPKEAGGVGLLQEVSLGDNETLARAMQDETLQNKIKDYRNAQKKKSNNAYTRHLIERAREDLMNYISYLAKKYKIDSRLIEEGSASFCFAQEAQNKTSSPLRLPIE